MNLKVFGCVAYVHVAKQERKIFDRKSHKTVFVVYPEGTKGHKQFNLSPGSFIRSRYVIFAEQTIHDLSTEKTLRSYPNGWQSENPIENESLYEDDDNAENNPPMGEAFEDQFMREVEQLGPQRSRRPPRRLIGTPCSHSQSAGIDDEEIFPLQRVLHLFDHCWHLKVA